MIKKLLYGGFILVFFAISAFLTFNSAGVAAYAEEVGNVDPDGADENVDDGYKNRGYDLDGEYLVNIAYRSYMKRISGTEYDIEVTLDKSFRFGENGEEKSKNLFDMISSLLSVYGFVANADSNGRLVAKIAFDSLTDYYIASGIDGYRVDEDNRETHKTFFYVDSISRSESVFSRIEDEGNYLNGILQFCYAAGIKREEVGLEYVYGTPYKIVDTNADRKTYNATNGLYLHEFSMNLDEKDRIVEISQHSPNSIGWYSLAVIIAIPIAAAVLAVYIIKRRKKKEY